MEPRAALSRTMQNININIKAASKNRYKHIMRIEITGTPSPSDNKGCARMVNVIEKVLSTMIMRGGDAGPCGACGKNQEQQ